MVGHDSPSLYAANNIARAAHYFRSMGGTTEILGLVVNRDDGSDTADKFAEAIGLPILTRIPLSRTVRELAYACKLALEDEQFNTIFGELTDGIHHRTIRPTTTYTPLEYDDFLRVFGAEEPEGRPTSATKNDLFGNPDALTLPVFTLMPVFQVRAGDPEQAKVQEMLTSIGVHVTGLARANDGITVTSGATVIRIGDTGALANKVAFLTALLGGGQI